MASNLIGLNEMFGIPETSFEVIDLLIAELVPYKNHKFKPSSEAKRQMIKESINEFGVLEPLIVRAKEDVPYPIDGKYEILAGHQRTQLSKELGLTTIPAIIKTGLSEDEAEQIVAETNMQRSFEEMRHSERAAVLASHYNATKRRNVRKEVLDEINAYLQTFANPVESRAEDGLSPMATNSLREVAKDHDLSKDTIARYIRIDTLLEEIKDLLDDGKIAVRAAVELSYINADNQKLFADLMVAGNYKCDIEKAKLIRDLQVKGKLTIASMTDVLSGKKVKKNPGTRKNFKLSGKVIQKYFADEQDEKKISSVIEEALKMYFGEE